MDLKLDKHSWSGGHDLLNDSSELSWDRVNELSSDNFFSFCFIVALDETLHWLIKYTEAISQL